MQKDTVYGRDVENLTPDSDADTSVVIAQQFCFAFLKGNPQAEAGSLMSMSEGFSGVFKSKNKARFDEQKKIVAIKLEMANVVIENDPAYYRKMELGDDPYINPGHRYGTNTFVTGEEWKHGTEVAGVICALRNNQKGGNGVTNSVKIMNLQISAHGWDEWDKDVANAIRYAVDNGAQIVNMSFGKYLSPQREWVNEAISYAQQKGVLLVAAAGNDGNNNDEKPFYPFKVYPDNSLSNLIKVGGSTYDSSLICEFSNYGKRSVDVFAPGREIYTSSPVDTYASVEGTSFAAPMVSGLAALLWSYYPTFTYKQIKYCIEKSATPINREVIQPNTFKLVPFSSLSKSGGIINAYNALIIAEQISKKGNRL